MNGTLDLPVLVSLLGTALSVATFFLGRMTAARTKGEQGGVLITEVRQVAKDVRDIKEDLADLRQEQGGLRDRITKVETKIELYHHDGGNA